MIRIVTFKANIIGLLLIPFLCSCSGNKAKNDLVKANLKGRVKSVIEYHYSTSNEFGELHKTKLFQKMSYSYNRDGNEVEEIKYGEDGNKDESRVFSYSNNGYEVEWNLFLNGRLNFSVYNKYDKNGNRLVMINRTMKSSFSDGGTVYNKDTLMKFDNNNNLIEDYVYSRGEMNGNIEYNDKYRDYTLSEKYTYIYDGRNNLMQSSRWVVNTYGNLGEPVITYYKYDGNNMIAFDYSGANYRMAYKYDDNGDKIEHKTILKNSGETETELYKYENYDKAKNWLKQIDNDKDGKTYIVEREINYYN